MAEFDVAPKYANGAMRTYLGDAVYVDFDGYALELTTEDGIRVTNRIVLEPEVYAELMAYMQRLRCTCTIAWGQRQESATCPVHKRE